VDRPFPKISKDARVTWGLMVPPISTNHLRKSVSAGVWFGGRDEWGADDEEKKLLTASRKAPTGIRPNQIRNSGRRSFMRSNEGVPVCEICRLDLGQRTREGGGD
jgi:hypothetical protein